jgi:hypothetical protein
MKNLFTVLFILLNSLAFSQITQTIRGKVLEKETQQSIPGANVIVVTDTTDGLKGAATDIDGNFRISNVKIGKQTVKITYVGYADVFIDVTVSSAKEVILTIEMEESAGVELAQVEIVAEKRGEVANDLSVVSARTFDVAETERYAGSRGDPARMASNFAGVQGADDSRNDIVVRGNSPLGVLYRLEGFDIPNPNHFSVAGSTGGPVSILNNKILGNSDFFTSAFPAEYGNSTAAVFDLKLRPGNNEKHEFSGQFGFLGTELAAEGPINKEKHSSYLAVYRYSTLSLFKMMGISLGTDAVPQYQDAAFKILLPTKNNKGVFSLFAMGGTSKIDIMISEQTEPAADFYGDDDRDQHFQTRMAVGGITYTNGIGKEKKTFMRSGIAMMHDRQASQHDYVIRRLDTLQNIWIVNDGKPYDTLIQLQRYKFRTNRQVAYVNFNTKLNSKHVLKYGTSFQFMHFSMLDSVELNPTDSTPDFRVRWNSNESGFLAQAFVQWKYKPDQRWMITAGLYNQFFSLSNSISVAEPRVGVKYMIDERQSLNLGAGLHSMTQPYYVYFYLQPKYDSTGVVVGTETDVNGNPVTHNKGMDFTKSIHSVLSYDVALKSNMRLKAEVYYQYLFNIPVEVDSSAFSLTNMGSGFARFFPNTLENKGEGKNMGIELTVEKFFDKSFYFLFTASAFDAKYKGSNGIWNNTDYNTKYAANALVGKEWKVKDKSSFSVGGKFTVAGGKWRGEIDTLASSNQRELVWRDENYNTIRMNPYMRLDLKVNYKINAKKVTHEFALDLVNVLNTKNILGLSYTVDAATGNPGFAENYQLGFLPLFYYRIDF